MKQKKEHPGMECSYKSRSPHNFSMETRKGLHGFGLRAADRGSQDSPTLSRQRERDCLRPLRKQTVSAIF